MTSLKDSGTALRVMTILVCAYLAVGMVTLVAIFLFRGDPGVVNDAVWLREEIVVVTAVLMVIFAVFAARGSRRAWLRVRFMSTVMVVAIAVIIVLPGPFPLWMKLDQGGCGLILIGVATIANGKLLRARFTRRNLP